MITRQHLSHILEPSEIKRAKTSSEQKGRRREMLNTLAWSMAWFVILTGVVAGLGIMLRFFWETFLRGWRLL